LVWSFYEGVDFYYRFLKALTAPQPAAHAGN